MKHTHILVTALAVTACDSTAGPHALSCVPQLIGCSGVWQTQTCRPAG